MVGVCTVGVFGGKLEKSKRPMDRSKGTRNEETEKAQRNVKSLPVPHAQKAQDTNDAFCFKHFPILITFFFCHHCAIVKCLIKANNKQTHKGTILRK